MPKKVKTNTEIHVGCNLEAGIKGTRITEIFKRFATL